MFGLLQKLGIKSPNPQANAETPQSGSEQEAVGSEAFLSILASIQETPVTVEQAKAQPQKETNAEVGLTALDASAVTKARKGLTIPTTSLGSEPTPPQPPGHPTAAKLAPELSNNEGETLVLAHVDATPNPQGTQQGSAEDFIPVSTTSTQPTQVLAQANQNLPANPSLPAPSSLTTTSVHSTPPDLSMSSDLPPSPTPSNRPQHSTNPSLPDLPKTPPPPASPGTRAATDASTKISGPAPASKIPDHPPLEPKTPKPAMSGPLNPLPQTKAESLAAPAVASHPPIPTGPTSPKLLIPNRLETPIEPMASHQAPASTSPHRIPDPPDPKRLATEILEPAPSSSGPSAQLVETQDKTTRHWARGPQTTGNSPKLGSGPLAGPKPKTKSSLAPLRNKATVGRSPQECVPCHDEPKPADAQLPGPDASECSSSPSLQATPENRGQVLTACVTTRASTASSLASAPTHPSLGSTPTMGTEHLVQTLRQALEVKTTPHDLRWTDPEFGELALRIERNGDDLEVSIRSAMNQTHETLKQHHLSIANELTLDPEQLRFESPDTPDQKGQNSQAESRFSDQNSKSKTPPKPVFGKAHRAATTSSSIPSRPTHTSGQGGLDLIA